VHFFHLRYVPIHYLLASFCRAANAGLHTELHCVHLIVPLQAYEAEAGKGTVAAQISRGEFVPLREWLRRKVHNRGSIPGSPDALLEEVCGEPLSVKPFLAYLKHKYTELYGLEK
jgi:hypothetical protein